ncbi:helix-turn-helix transcriptional regulator [Fulvivirga sp. M361]|uniref:helix-turn-helix domain-containing protein n=1 Tax=Fulvivirga sp. M361 TaxID=2594266 RepID=UPI001179FBB7|nr:helix-turn-helix transcriptional regulator [Fulvivirga sp. M361]TRX54350.1 helix-turn-helix transcriptional regulator [Fulvivirga sp. M361]
MKKHYTEQDAIATVEKSLFVVGNGLASHIMDIEDIKNLVPCYFHLNNSATAAVEYIDPDISKYFTISDEDVQEDGMAALRKVCHPVDVFKVTDTVSSCFGTPDQHKVISVFERLRKRKAGTDEYDLHFTVFKLLNADQCLGLTIPVSNIHNTADKISDILDEHAFFKKNFEQFALLTKREKNILKLLGEGYNNPQISEKLHISRRTVENHRKSVNRKLNIKNFHDIIKYTKTFNLI